MNRQELIDAIAEDLFSYAMAGHINVDAVANELKPSGLADRYVDFESLVRLHFILLPEVIDFVEALPDRLRHIKTESTNTQSDVHGEIRGRINWPATIARRYREAPGDRSRFVIDERTREYDIPENIVLKRVLLVIHETLTEHEGMQRRSWFTDRWDQYGERIRTLQRIMEQNVHIRRIRDPGPSEPTPRMVADAGASRLPVYRDAAKLYRSYHSSLDGDTDAIRDLLGQTLITPDEDDQLFELHVAFQLIRAVERYSDRSPNVRAIQSSSQALATIPINRSTSVEVYHDSSGRERDLSFISDAGDKRPAERSRTERASIKSDEVEATYFDEPQRGDRTGRPDVIILKLVSNDHVGYLVTEVKFSASRNRIRQGIRELLEYLTFMRNGGSLVHSPPAIFGPRHRGLLVIDDLEDHVSPPIADQEQITILQAEELDEYLDELLGQMMETPISVAPD